MEHLDLEQLFAESFDTFKAFDTLTVANAGVHHVAFPTTIWQILNHLIQWQDYQLQLLEETSAQPDIRESNTWIKEKAPESEACLTKAVNLFNKQLGEFQAEIYRLNTSGDASISKLKLIQEASLHLSFHLGEVVLIRRLTGSYPLPHQMKEFLAE